jgi:uncharacterized protein (TIGR04141 family)
VAGTPATMTLSIRLLREGKTVEDGLRDILDLTEQKTTSGRLFTDQSVATPPSWLSFVSEFSADPPLKLENKNCAAVLFLVVTPDGQGAKPRTFALTFGSGHHALNPDAFERNFGLKVALNSVARRNLKNLDVATLESTSFQKRIQASRRADLQGFGIDIQRDLLRLAGGVPTDTSFASSLSGKDALTINTKTSAANVAAKCEQAFQLFGATDYKKDYAFIDLITPVRDRTLINELDDLIFTEIQELIAGRPSDLHLTLPEIVDPEASHEIGYFGVGFRSGAKTGYGELAIEDYISELTAGHPEQLDSIAKVKSTHEIRVVVDGEGNKEMKRRLYDCFVYETTHKKKIYVLFSSEWYCVEDKFFASVEADFQALLSPTSIIASTAAKNEQQLIEELDANPDLLNLDKVKTSPLGAAGANLEPCDFLSLKKEFIHLKDGHGSAPISHLWSQGVVSAESFVRDDGFRKSMRKSVITRQQQRGKTGFETLLPNGRSKPVPTDYKVIYGIMRHAYQRSKKLDLPFFSKVSLRAAANRIQLMGYTVEVQLIEKK